MYRPGDARRNSYDLAMSHFLDRRTFLHSSLLTAGALSSWPRLILAQTPSGAAQAIVARPFDLSQVRLRPGVALDALNVNRRHLMGYDRIGCCTCFG